MQRAERIGLGVALVGHIALFAALSLGLFSADDPPVQPDPVQVSLIGEIAPIATAPQLSNEAPAPAPADDIGETLDSLEAPPSEILPRMETPAPATAPEPTPPRAQPRPTPKPAAKPKPQPKPEPKAKVEPAPKAAPKAEPKASMPPRQTNRGQASASRSRSFADNMRGTLDGAGKADSPPAAAVSQTVRRQIDVSINGKVRGPWNNCQVTGVDVDQLKTTVRFSLTRSGGLGGIDSVRTSGQNDSNRAQISRFEECAKRAIQLAAPFSLPQDGYDIWKSYTLDFEKR